MADEKKELQKLKFDDVKEYNKSGKCWVVIHDHVYDVSKFLDEVNLLCFRLMLYFFR